MDKGINLHNVGLSFFDVVWCGGILMWRCGGKWINVWITLESGDNTTKQCY
jgi:hypothetical protein